MKKIFNKIIELFREFSFRDFLKLLSDANVEETRKSFVTLWVIVVFIIIIVTWAAVSEINQVVRANGEVTPESQVHLIQSNLTGPIEIVNIKMGDKISKGDILFHIARSTHEKNFLTTKAEVEARRKKVSILQDLFDKGAESEIRLIDEKLQLLESEKRLNNAKTAFEYSEVRSSVTGTVSSVEAKNIGQVVNTGETLADVVPDNANLRLKVMVETKDIAFVKPGYSAKIAFSSYDMAIYGQFDGIVKTVSASTVLSQDNIPFYTTIIEVDDKELERLNKIKIISGMQASVSIISQKRTVLSYLFNPITKLSQTALRE
ncbi:MAG: hypothetical protein CMA40_00065 [Euryarchaeota archaeon]|nr:hypothetical protein [Euryarchaeota archaeon]|tara:strand:+ start:11743 stop:12696 length:954 start_codon:yes stop_codon:yes gene_type:complete